MPFATGVLGVAYEHEVRTHVESPSDLHEVHWPTPHYGCCDDFVQKQHTAIAPPTLVDKPAKVDRSKGHAAPANISSLAKAVPLWQAVNSGLGLLQHVNS